VLNTLAQYAGRQKRRNFYNIEPGDGGCVVEVGPHRHDDVVGGVVLGLASYRPSLFKVHLH
jgi:hypothetical protein